VPKDLDKTTLITSTTLVDYTTGEVMEKQEVTHIKKSAEPNYIKLYISTLLVFKDLPKNLNPILIQFLSYMSYADISEKNGGQKIYVNIDMKKDIAEKLNLSLESVNKGLFQLTKSGLFKRIGTGTYQVNPYLFGKGEWKDISAIRATFDFNTGEVIADIEIKEE
jgi:Firmicute plasmid replication protein (RepL).